MRGFIFKIIFKKIDNFKILNMDLENLIEFPTAAYTYYLFLKAFRIIQADRNKILN